MKIKLIPKQKNLLKSSTVRCYLRHMEKEIEKQMNKPEIQTALVLGLPLMFYSDGTLKAVDIYKYRRGRT